MHTVHNPGQLERAYLDFIKKAKPVVRLVPSNGVRVFGVLMLIYLSVEYLTGFVAVFKFREYKSQSHQYKTNLELVLGLKAEWLVLNEKLINIDLELPGLSTNEIEILLAANDQAVMQSNFFKGITILQQANEVADQVLAHQDEIAAKEIDRLGGVLSANLKEVDLLLGDTTIVTLDNVEFIESPDAPVVERLRLARELVGKTADEVKKRRVEVDHAQKQIVVDKSELKLTMYENGEDVYSMPVSLGRPGAQTRDGEFEILDRLGTVWSLWQIWLPYWMGIYYAGSSENGIHGLPYDNTGNTYWVKEVGQQNITYGCVMPPDNEMSKLYNWAEVGVPVVIVP